MERGLEDDKKDESSESDETTSTYTWSVPKVMRVIFLRSPERPGNESGSRGRWRGEPRIQLTFLS